VDCSVTREYADRVAGMAVIADLLGVTASIAQAVPWRLGAVLLAMGRHSPRSDYVAVWWHDPARGVIRYVVRSGGGEIGRVLSAAELWDVVLLDDHATCIFTAPAILHAVRRRG